MVDFGDEHFDLLQVLLHGRSLPGGRQLLQVGQVHAHFGTTQQQQQQTINISTHPTAIGDNSVLYRQTRDREQTMK